MNPPTDRNDIAESWWPEGVLFRGKRTTDAPITIEEKKATGLLSRYLQSFWDMRWELKEKMVSCVIVPSGCVNLVFHLHPIPEKTLRSKIVGVRTVAHTIEMCGSGASFGVRFTPGGFHAFSKEDLASFTDGTAPLEPVFGDHAVAINEIVFSERPLEDKVDALEAVFAALIPGRPSQSLLELHEIMKLIQEDDTIKNTSGLTRKLGMTDRTLQRLFAKYVGISPTMWIRTKRFQQAAKSVLAGKIGDWSELANELGYYDQSHFINDFKNLTGKRPSELVSEGKEFLSPFSNTEKGDAR